MKKRIISVLKYLVFLFIGIGLLWLVFRKLDLHSIADEIKHANYWWIGLSIILGVFSHLFRALRWNLMINSLGYKTRTSTTFYAVMVGYLANTAIPRLGEITRCGVLSKKDKIPFDSLFGSVIAERVFDIIVLAFIMFAVIIFQLDLLSGFLSKHVISPINSKFSDNGLSSIIIISVIVLLLALFIVLLKLYAPRLRKLSFFNKIEAFFTGLLDGIKTILKIKTKALFLFYSFMIWVCYSLMTYVAFFAIQATSKLTVIDGITVMSMGSLGFVAPVPGGIGAYHFIVKAVLVELYKVPSEPAASYATILHSAQTIMIVLVGAFSYLMLMLLTRKSKNEES
ncbi:MAG: flippase-like domain-containing protein [Bacteroidales bacterium]|nr:flippase-like domain-containing protein [Bacteroidales bacterium]